MENMFAYSMTQWLCFFYVYCFLGWCFESAYVSLKKGRLVNRGFMRGPFLPLYGSGAIMMLVVSSPFQDMDFPGNLILTYVAGCIGATALEYVTGVVMEALFKVRYWDYSKNRFNFQGHICLGSSLAWGLLTIFMTETIHRPIERLVLAVPGEVLTPVTFLVTAFVGADFALSFKAAMDLRDVLVRMEKLREEMSRVQKRLDMVMARTREEMEERREEKEARRVERAEELAELKEKYRLHMADKERLTGLRDVFQRELIRSNPTMSSQKFGDALRELQEKLEQRESARRSSRNGKESTDTE
jgi:uncharacterized membrane protein